MITTNKTSTLSYLMYLCLCALMCIGLAGVSPYAFAQTTSGDLVGTVLDPSGAGVPNANVEATNVETNVKTTATTNARGEYRFSNLLIGRYDVTANATGFTATSLHGVQILLNSTQTANLNMQVGQTTTTVDVQEAGATIDTTTSQLENSFDSRQILDLPQAAFSGPNATAGIANLSLLNSGVSTAAGSGYGVGPSVGGQRPTNNSFNVEGVDNNDKGITGPIIYVPIDSIGQYSVLQNQFNPEFGFSSGGIFNANIKSGSNSIHGAIYDYLQNRMMNAVDQTVVRQGLTSNPRFDMNRLGANIGGPIIKNKLFYFADFEYVPIGQAPVPGGAIFAPTAAGYSRLASIPGVSSTNLKVLQQYLAAAPTATTTTPVGANPNVPGSVSVAIPIGPISVVGPSFQNQYNLATSGDWNISDKDQFRLRYVYNKLDAVDTAANLPAFWGTQQNYVHLASAAEFHNFSPTAINEFRFSYSRKFNNFANPDVSFPGLDAFPNILIENDLNLQLGPNQNNPQGYIQNIYQGTDNFTKLAGRHTIKIGYDIHDIIASNTFVQRARGDYDYTNLNQYLLDLTPNDLGERSVGAAGGIPAGFLQHGAYANDDFRVSSHLTLNLGMRYEYVTVPIVSRAQSLNSVANLPGVLVFNSPKSQNNNWAPRVGFAYTPGTSGKTVFRGGFGISYDQFYNNLAINAKPPFYQSTLDVDVNSNAPNFLAKGGLSGAVPPPTTDPLVARANTASYTTDQIRPYSINWTFGMQHVFRNDYTFEARYVGTRGVHLWVQQQLNRASVVTPTRYIPTFFQAPSAAQLAGLNLTLGAMNAIPNNPLAPYGFTSTITSYQPIGNSIYHGIDFQLTRRYTNNLSFVAAYTLSHNIDDSTNTVFSSYLAPRRAQDFGNLRAERGTSLLDHRHRVSLTALYDVPWFRGSNWVLKNVVGNWNVSGTYTYESPTYATVQSGIDSNLNNDSAGDRAIVNPSGQEGVGSGVFGVDRNGNRLAAGSAGIVAYVALNSNAQYVQTGLGALATGGRNTLRTYPINNVDAALTKRFSITEKTNLQLGGQFFNLFNHSQFISGYLSDVTSLNFTANGRNYLLPANPLFNQTSQFFPSNARTLQVTAKITF